VIGGDALNGDADNVASLAVGFLARAGFRFTNDDCRVVRGVIPNAVEEYFSRLFVAHSSEHFKPTLLLSDRGLKLLLQFLDLPGLA
jgi:hypothetical protein